MCEHLPTSLYPLPFLSSWDSSSFIVMPTSQLQLPPANHSSLRDSKAYGAGLCKFHVPCNVFLLGKVHVFQSRIQKFLTPRFGETPTSSLYQFENIYQQY